MTIATETLAQPMYLNQIHGAFLDLAKQKLGDLLIQGYRINGFAIAREVEGSDPQRGFITVDGLVGWWTPGLQALERAHEAMEALRVRCELVEAAIEEAKAVERERDELRAQVEALSRDTERQASKISELCAELEDREARHRIDRQRLQTIQEHRLKECWYWQGDGQDHLESLVGSLPVVIRADQLRVLTRPAVPDAWVSEQYGGEFDDMTAGQGYRKGWNDCRAAMVAAAPQPDFPPLNTPEMDLVVNRAHAYVRQANPAVRGSEVAVNAGALQMVRNALQRDADEGKQSRREMLADLEATIRPISAITEPQRETK